MSDGTASSPLGGQQAAEPPATPPSGADSAGGDSSSSAQDSAAGAGNDSVAAEGGNDSVPALTAESYSTLQIPEGFEINEEAFGQFKTLAAEAGVQPEAAQKLFDLYTAQTQAQVKAWSDTIEGWQNTIKTDPEIGGERTAQVTEVIGKALDQFGSQEAREAFDVTGAGWNPAIIKFIHKMASALNEGTQIPGGRPAGTGKRTGVEALYPNG